MIYILDINSSFKKVEKVMDIEFNVLFNNWVKIAEGAKKF